MVPYSFATETSIHGLRYIINPYGTSTRIFWLVAIALSLFGFTVYFTAVFGKFHTTPDTGIIKRETSARDIPLPAITVCSPKNVRSSYLDISRAANIIVNGSVEEQKRLSAFLTICKLSHDQDRIKHHAIDKEIIERVKAGSISIEDTFIECSDGMRSTCESMFDYTLTPHGVCYSYNMLPSNKIVNDGVDVYNIHTKYEAIEWSLSDGYSGDANDNYPRRVVKNLNDLLKFSMSIPRVDTFKLCPDMRSTYKLYIHLPNEVPTTFSRHVTVGIDNGYDVTIRANIATTSKALRRFRAKERGCFFEGERPLQLFRTYTESLCEYECLINYTRDFCGCVRLSMPHLHGTPVCGLNMSECLQRALQSWPIAENKKSDEKFPCDCLPPCTNIEYTVKRINFIDYDFEPVSYEGIMKSILDYQSMFEILFDEYQVSETHTYLAYDLQDFMADIGGLIGFFMGCSVLSLVEVAYYAFGWCVAFFRRISAANVVRSGDENAQRRQIYDERSSQALAIIDIES